MEDLTDKLIDGMDLNVSVCMFKWDGRKYHYGEGDKVLFQGKEWKVLSARYYEYGGEENKVELYLC